MKTKIVYVLASSQEDYFLEQCLISLKFLRKYNPEAYVVLVCDDTTESSLNGNRQDIKLLINELKSIQFERPVNKVERSRLMKVNLRKYVEGDFLYIDCDTIIVNDLSEIDNFTFSIGAVLDGHQPLKSHPMRSYFKKQNQISTIILMKSFHIIVEVSCIQRMMNLLMISMLIGIIIIWNL